MAGTNSYHRESSSFRNNCEHQVFLSFRGEDFRRTFVDHLYDALKGSGFTVFRDNDGVDHGEDIQSKLYQAIERSQLSIVTLSHRYADSQWCLDELVKIMDCRSTLGHTVLPVFYNVEPTHVRHQSGPFEEAFRAHALRFGGGMSRVNNWRLALEQVSALKGMSFKDFDGYEAQFIQNIVKEVRKIVDPRLLYLPPYIVGTDSIVEEISNWLQDGSGFVELGVIYGLGGIGKTTIAKIAYNNNLDKFDGCSFLSGLKEKLMQGNGFASLLEQLITDISGETPNKVYNFDKGMMEMRAILSCRRVLLVLDNVNSLAQIRPLLQISRLLHPGSKIIITTINKVLGNYASIKRDFQVHSLRRDESTSVFCQHAFGKGVPSKNFEIVSERFVEYCGGLPLALEVLALSLRGLKLEMWKSQLAKFESFPNRELFDIFKLSFDSLEDDNDKDIFLHVAFFLVGMQKDQAIRILDSCDLHPKIGLQNLNNRCLVTVDWDDRLMMHHLIQKMGKDVVRLEAQREPGKRSRLWRSKDVYSVLQNNEGTDKIKGLRLDFPMPHTGSSLKDEFTRQIPKRMGWPAFFQSIPSPITGNSRSVRTDAFTKMKNLNFLQLNNVQLEGGFRNFPKAIKLLQWNGCTLESLPIEFDLHELVVLEMCNSRLVHAWEAGKFLGALSVLNLSHSHHLVDTPDFSLAPMLEWMSFEDCVSLVKIHESIGGLTKLAYLNLNGCINLRRLPNGINKLHTLKVLDLSGCPCVSNGPNKLRLLSTILWSYLGTAPITTTKNPNSSLSHFGVPTSPDCSFSSFQSLTKLSMRNCSIYQDDIFYHLRWCPLLRNLDLSGNPINVIDKELSYLTMLDFMRLDNCTNLQSVSKLPLMTSISLNNCISLERIYYNPGMLKLSVYLEAQCCPKLIEIEGLYKLEATEDMDSDRARYMGYSNLESFDGSKGLYPSEYGLYSLFLHGNHIANWFTTVTSGNTRLLYIVPLLPNYVIRAFNVGGVFNCELSPDSCVMGTISIKNVTCKWKYKYATFAFTVSHPKGLEESCKLTWLTHWCVVEHRELRPGDQLEVSFEFLFKGNPLQCGIEIIYEELVEDEAEVVDRDNAMQTVESHGSSSSFRECMVNETGNEDGGRIEKNKKVSAVADWYNNTFCAVDLSRYRNTPNSVSYKMGYFDRLSLLTNNK